ncbi:MAG: PD-(D/E)XK nuclease family protein [Armatimonadetes bacterium]|nr:PD-(D/E)XK nuclease family protein [Armatimonadota bacterium]
MQVRTVPFLPGGGELAKILRPLAKKGPVIVACRKPTRLPALQAILEGLEHAEPTSLAGAVSKLRGLCDITPVPFADESLILTLIHDACSNLPDDSPFKPSERFAGTHQAIRSCLIELSETEILGQLSSLQVEDPHLQAKLQGLLEINDAVRHDLERLRRTTLHAQMEGLLEQKLQTDGLKGMIYLWDEEDGAATTRLLEWVASQGVAVHCLVPTHPFLGGDAPAQSHPSACLFVEKAPDAMLPQSLFVAGGIQDEVEWVLRDVASKIQGGERVDQFALICRDVAAYAPFLAASAARFKLPLRLSARAPLLSNGYVRFLLKLLKALSALDLRPLSSLATSRFFGVETEEGLAARQMMLDLALSPIPWEELEAKCQDGEQTAWLFPILEWRLAALRSSVKIQGWIDQLIDLTSLLNLPASTLEKGPDAERTRRAEAAMRQCLARLGTTLSLRPNPQFSLRAFVRLCEAAWQDAEYSLPSLDAGIRITHEPDELVQAKHVYMLDMLEGRLPRRRREDPILRDDEKLVLRQLTGKELKDSSASYADEQMFFVRALGMATASVTYSYAREKGEQEQIPSYFLDEARRLGPVNERFFRRDMFAPTVDPILTCDQELAAALAQPEAPLPAIELPAEAAKLEEGFKFSTRQLHDAFICPFLFFIRHRMGIKTRDRGAAWTRLTSILEKTNPAALPLERLRPVLEQKFEEFLAEAATYADAQELAGFASIREQFIEGIIERESVARELWKESGPYDLDIEQQAGGIRARFDVLKSHGGVTTGTVYRYSTKHWESPDGSAIDNFEEFALLRLLERHRGTNDVAVVVDTVTEGKVAYYRHKGPFQTRLDAKVRGASIARIQGGSNDGGNANDQWQDHVDNVNNALKRSRAGFIRPDPTDSHCRYCGYGELCRRSYDFGEEEREPTRIPSE